VRRVLPNCRKCSEPIDSCEKRASGGNLNVCKSCRVAYFAAYNARRDKSNNRSKTEDQKRKRAEYCAAYWRINQDRLADYHARYRAENRERINSRQRAYREKNLEAVKDSKKRRSHVTNARNKHRYETEPGYKLKVLVRARLTEVIKNLKGSVGFTAGESYRLLGCSLTNLREHIEGQFRDGMTWDNHATVWELDHIKPLAAFDLIDVSQLKEACHYTNLQPLLCAENNTKSDFHEGVRTRRTVRDVRLAQGHEQQMREIRTDDPQP
jgi:hypothetical protein